MKNRLLLFLEGTVEVNQNPCFLTGTMEVNQNPSFLKGTVQVNQNPFFLEGTMQVNEKPSSSFFGRDRRGQSKSFFWKGPWKSMKTQFFLGRDRGSQ